MTPVMLVHAAVAASGVLALWLYVRLGERRPRSLARVIVHLAIVGVLLAVMPTFLDDVVGADESATGAAAGLFGVVVPGMTYSFLVALYLLEQLQRRLLAR